MRNTISGQVFAEMIFCASAALDENRQQLNELNVFPVPDGDTGTNMSLTMSAAAAALRGRTPSAVGDAADTAASALLRGARGNSGVILSLLFRGLAKSLRGKAECRGGRGHTRVAQGSVRNAQAEESLCAVKYKGGAKLRALGNGDRAEHDKALGGHGEAGIDKRELAPQLALTARAKLKLHFQQALPLPRGEHAGLVIRARQALVGRAEDDKVLYAAAAVAVKVTGRDAVK